MAEYKRGQVVRRVSDWSLWRVSNRGCAYPINEAGHRLGRDYTRLAYLSVTTDAETERLSSKPNDSES